ncbi:MAG: RNA methyltransferase [Paracoccaceae bacterium]
MPARNAKDCSPSDQRAAALKDAHLVQTKRGYRQKRGQFFVEGVRNYVRAVDTGFVLEHVFYSEKLLINPLARKLVRQGRRDGVPTLAVSPEEFRTLSITKRASGVAALVRQRWMPLRDVLPARHMCWIVLEQVQSAGNFGTLIRSSSAAGGAGFILIGPNVDPYAPAVIRAAMGSVFQQIFVRTHKEALQDWIAQTKSPVIGATPAARDDLHGFVCPERAPLLVLGEERKGLSKLQKGLCNHFVRIPMLEGTESLNLGVAGSLLLYEVHRQRYGAF